MNKQDKQIIKLSENIMSLHTIQCSKCKKSQDCYIAEDCFNAAEYFLEQGWWATDSNIYCLECNNKRKK